MSITIGYAPDQEFCVDIRENIECGQCSSSTLVLWQKEGIGERPKGTSLATFTVDENGTEVDIYYLVRCSFFKFNVTDPEHIVFCEGFKRKTKDPRQIDA